ncbi:MAG: DUF5362 domain-containing protein [Melioribacteraceae bacterium]|nr:DUF5362 domain-containing protein [Melioribacteraceae bacterium]MCF8353830.1 DUF5362 domain-containing protein [Melioribacteraceae bacterium]MCF8393666.1 DUF5362 domain-containing protein [Melioribacteraceae bacterium]MCF8419476.1 DUF5362 domain-containing protein [Melioribacteraceae bacterium]
MDLNEHQQQVSNPVLDKLLSVSINMVGWLKFLGVMNILSGVATALTIVGIIVAWVPIWLGVLLFQAGSQIKDAQHSGNHHHLVAMMEKLKLYFIIQGVLILLGLIFVLIIFMVTGISIMEALSSDMTY